MKKIFVFSVIHETKSLIVVPILYISGNPRLHFFYFNFECLLLIWLFLISHKFKCHLSAWSKFSTSKITWQVVCMKKIPVLSVSHEAKSFFEIPTIYMPRKPLNQF